MIDRVFDADAHIIDAEADIARLGGIQRRRLMPSDAWDRSLGGKYPFLSPTPTEHLDFMNHVRIATAVVYPTRALSLGLLREQWVAASIVEGYHQLALSFCSASDRLQPAALALPHDPAHTENLLEQYVRAGFRALTILPHGCGGLLGDSRFFGIYERCEALSIPITVHPNSAGVPGFEDFNSFVELHTCSVPAALIKQFVSLTFSGVFERFPKLRWFFPEAGAGWLPYWIDRMDKEFMMRREEASLTSLPSEVLARAPVYVSFGGMERSLPDIDRMVGGGVVWASDFPHWDHEREAPVRQVAAEWGDAVAHRLFVSNATSLYRVNS